MEKNKEPPNRWTHVYTTDSWQMYKGNLVGERIIFSTNGIKITGNEPLPKPYILNKNQHQIDHRSRCKM